MKKFTLLIVVCISGVFATAQGKNQNNLTSYGSFHLKQGKAKINKVGNEVVVSEIGNSGNDGVKIDFKSGEYHTDIKAQEYPVGSQIVSSLYGDINGNTTQVGSLTIDRNSSSSINISPDFSPVGSQTYRLEIYDDELGLVYSKGGLSGDIEGETEKIQFPIKGCKHKKYFDYPNGYTYYYTLKWVGFKEKAAISTPDGQTIEGSMIAMFAENPTVIIDDYSKEIITAKNVPSFTIENEWLIKYEDHISFTTFDETKFKSELNGKLEVTNMPSKDYTTRVEFLEFLNGSVTTSTIDLRTSNFNAMSSSSSLEFNVVANWEEPTSLGNVELQKNNDGMDLSADFSDAGSDFNVAFFRQGRTVFKQRQTSSLIGKILIHPSEANDMFRVVPSINSFALEFEKAIKFELPSGETGFVERIEITPTNPDFQIDNIAYIDVNSNDINKTIIEHAYIGEQPTITTGSSTSDPIVEVVAHPNPFDDVINLTITPIESGECKIELVDGYGTVIGNIFNQNVQAGSTYSATYNGTNLIPGSYYCRTFFNSEFYQEVLIKN